MSSEREPSLHGGRILLTGASGRLGRKLFSSWRAQGLDVVGTASEPRPGLLGLELRSREQVRAALEALRPRVIVHAAALTDVEACERDEAAALLVNAESSALFAAYADAHDAQYVYVSTDYVFDGEQGPYLESAAPAPLSAYGRSKLAGERAALAARSGSVARVGILYGYNGTGDGPTVVSQVVAKLRRSEPVALDGRRLKYPTLTDDVARALTRIIAEGACGIFHLAPREPISRYEWGRCIARCFELDEGLVLRDDQSERGQARRPRDVALLDSRLGFAHTPLQSALQRIRSQMGEAAEGQAA